MYIIVDKNTNVNKKYKKQQLFIHCFIKNTGGYPLESAGANKPRFPIAGLIFSLIMLAKPFDGVFQRFKQRPAFISELLRRFFMGKAGVGPQGEQRIPGVQRRLMSEPVINL